MGGCRPRPEARRSGLVTCGRYEVQVDSLIWESETLKPFIELRGGGGESFFKLEFE